LAAFPAEIAHQVGPGAVDSVIYPFRFDPVNAPLGLRLIDGIISTFLLYPADVVSPPAIKL